VFSQVWSNVFIFYYYYFLFAINKPCNPPPNIAGQPLPPRPTQKTTTSHPASHPDPSGSQTPPDGPKTNHYHREINPPQATPTYCEPNPQQNPQQIHNKSAPINTKCPTPIKWVSRFAIEDIVVEENEERETPWSWLARIREREIENCATPLRPPRLHRDHREHQRTHQERGRVEKENSDDGERG
jgi:hypothetical protein